MTFLFSDKWLTADDQTISHFSFACSLFARRRTGNCAARR
jgi:hypothetical protein